jgi:hypothetical protein
MELNQLTKGHDLLSTSTITTIVSLVIFCVPSAAGGQQTARGVLTDMPQDARLEITAPGLWLSDVTLRDVRTDSVHVLSHGAVVPVAFTEIETLAVREGRGALGAALGGGSGLLAGGLFGLMVASFGCRDPVTCAADDRRGTLVGGLVGAGVGAAVGYWIGSGSVRWTPVFP